MLPLMLMLVADPLTPPPASPPPSTIRFIGAGDGMRPVAFVDSSAQAECRNGELHRAEGRASASQRAVRPTTRDLMFRQGDPVEMTLLLERRIGNCSVPISYDVAPDGRLPSFPARPQ